MIRRAPCAIAAAALIAAAMAEPATPVGSVINDIHRTPGDGALEEGFCHGDDCTQGDVLLDLLSFEFDTAIATGASDTGYIGQWDGDVKSGHGMETTEVGDYQGQFQNGRRDGMGEFRWAVDHGPAESYKGFWREGQMDGLGSMTFENGDRFFGVWNMGQKAGEGFYLDRAEMDVEAVGTDGAVQMKQAICVYDDGSTYSGQIWAPLRVSGDITAVRKAAEVRDPVDTVDGECHWVPGTDGTQFEFVKPHGKGVLEYANGDRYAGGWELGRPHGPGMLVKTDGTAEYGDWDHGNQVQVNQVSGQA